MFFSLAVSIGCKDDMVEISLLRGRYSERQSSLKLIIEGATKSSTTFLCENLDSFKGSFLFCCLNCFDGKHFYTQMIRLYSIVKSQNLNQGVCSRELYCKVHDYLKS